MTKMKLVSTRSGYSRSKTVKEEYKTGVNLADYSKYFMDAPKAPTYMTANVKSDSALLQEAKNRFDGLYDTYINNSKRNLDFNIQDIVSQRDSLKPVYEGKLSDLELGFKQNNRDLINSAVRKGMGRSSFLIDSKNDNIKRLEQSRKSIESEKQQKYDALNRAMEKERLNFENQKDVYNAKRQVDIDNLYASLKKEQNKEIFNVQKYNDQLYANHLKLVEDAKKHNFNVQKYLDSINVKKITVTTTTRTSSSSTYKPETGLDRERVEALWNSMSGEQRVKYMQQNGSALAKVAPDLYSKYYPQAQTHLVDMLKTSFR